MESYSETHFLYLYPVGNCLFSSSSFSVSGFTFRSLIHLQLVFGQGDRQIWSSFCFSTYGLPVFPALFLEDAIFSSLYVFGIFFRYQKVVVVTCPPVSVFFVLLVYVSLFVPLPYSGSIMYLVIWNDNSSRNFAVALAV